MGKPKSRRKSRFPQKDPSRELNSDDEYDREPDPDPSSRSYIYDEIDEFHANREKILLDGGTKLDDSDDSDAEDAVYELSGDDDDDDDYEEEEEEEEENVRDEEEGLPSVKAWGRDRLTYYDTDYVDYGLKGYSQLQADDEEADAMAIQKRLLEQMDDQDFGIDILSKGKVSLKKEKKETEIIERDLTSLTKQEKLELLEKESPELLSMIEDFRAKLLLLRDKIRPLVDLVEKGEIPIGPGTDYLHVKYELLLNYCTNVCFYLMLKAKRIQTRLHPIIKRLVFYRNLLKELEPIDRQMESDMEAILECLNSGNDVSNVIESISKQVLKKKKRNLKALVNWQKTASVEPVVTNGETSVREKKMQTNKVSRETQDEKKALQLYSQMIAGRKQTKVISEIDDSMSLSEGSDIADEDDADKLPIAEGDKRKVSYKIAKNKGLMPYRKKVYRHPRIRNKIKFNRAKIRRRSQVHDVKREVRKYSGEISGIKATTSRSIKIK